MKIEHIDNQGYLWSVSEVFDQDLYLQIVNCNWQGLPYDRLTIGLSKRRLIKNESIPFIKELTDYINEIIIPTVENTCKVKFTDKSTQSVNWWLDEPGFQPFMHTDGDLPAAMQIYLLPIEVEDLGTAFFHSQDRSDLWHSFSSTSNTGYLMFNNHKHIVPRKLLWHDMLTSVPEPVQRVCCYIDLGIYTLDDTRNY